MSDFKVTKDLNCSVTFYFEQCVLQNICTGKVKMNYTEQDWL